MKRFFKLFAIILAFTPLLVKSPISVYADEVEPAPQQEEIDTEQELADKISEFLGQYLNTGMVADIVSWLMSSGVLAFALSVLLKVRKYKDYNVGELVKEFEGKIGDYLKDNFDKLSSKEITKIKDSLCEVEKAQETLMKVLVLMQDNTAKGKIALLDYLGSKTNSEEVKDSIGELNTTLEEQVKIVEETQQALEEGYKDIF